MKRLVLAILFVLSLAVAANAQTFRGAINGTVTDPSGAVVPNAAVKATESATGIDHNTVTTSDGAFSFQDIPLGFYKVSVTASGFPVYTVDKVEVTAGTIYTLPVKLSLQQQATTVEVSAAALTLDTTTPTQNMTISSDVVQDVPLNGRDFTQLVATAPGYGGYSVGGFGSLNGTRPNQMNWQIDGVDNNDFWHNIPAVNQGGVSGIAGVVLPIDSIEEFSSQTQSGAEAGRNAGGTVNLITKSGGNTLHGSVYYYNRNEFYSAKSPFFTPAPGTKAPPLRNQNYGFLVNGPIRKDKAFYLVSFEKQQYIIGLSGVATEPSDAWITLATDLLNNPGNKYGSYAPISPSSLSATLIGPTGFWPRSGSGSIAGLPAVNNNFFSPIASIGHSYNGVAKVDYNFNDKHRLSLRWFGGQGDQTAPLGGSPALGTASSNLKYYFEDAPIHVFNYSLTLNSVLTPRLTNQVLVGANYFNQTFSDFNNSFDTKAMGLFLSPAATINEKPIHGAPNIVIGNFEQIGLTPPEGRSDLTWHATDIVSYNRGAHQFRFGGEVRQAHVNEFYHRRGTGKFVFDGTQGSYSGATGCGAAAPTPACAGLVASGLLGNAEALADFLAGDVTGPNVLNKFKTTGSTIAVGNPERWVVVNAYNFYFQDSWQATKRLNLNFGMRYEYFGPLHSSKKDIAVFIPGKGLVIQGNGIDSIFPPDRNNFAPRIGFAYQATSRGDLVVRGGIGVFYDQINMNPFLDFRPPVAASQGIQGNAFGPSPVSTYSRNAYNWGNGPGQAQAGGTSIFPGVQECTDPNCAAPGDPKGLSAYSVNQNFRTPYFYNFDLQVEKSLGSAAVLQVGYVGSEGRKLNIVTNINAGSANFPNFGNVLQLNSIGTSNYNSLQSTFRIRTWHGLSSQFGYTWSHALDEISEYRATIADDPNNIKLDYGNGDYDTRHLFTANLTYALPKAGWARGWSDKLVNGWQLSSLWVLHSGQPYDITRSGLNLIGDPFAGLSHSFSKSIPGVQWINPAAFCTPGAVGCTGPTNPNGNVARNRFVGPSYKSVDFSVLKNVPITERVRVQLRAEMFNLFNRINFASGPGSVNGDGTVTDTIGDFNGAPGIGPGEPFNMQLALKIIF
jgi:Carboxypeptidase regulatory-like domain/TonB dependent receptor